MKNTFTLVLGRKGQGKTHWTKQFVKNKKRLIVFDPRRQFSECGVIIDKAIDFYTYLQDRKNKAFRIIYQPESKFSTRSIVKIDFMKVCKAVSFLENIYFVIDEINLCTSKSSKENEWFINIIDAGRHLRQSMIATTLRYTNIDPDLRSQADNYIIFQTKSEADVKHFSWELGDIAKNLPSLPPYHYVKCEDGKVSINKPI